MITAEADVYPKFYRCPCGCGWVRDDVKHLTEYLASTGYGLSALAGAQK